MSTNWAIAVFAAAVGLFSGLFSGLAGRRLEEWLFRPRLKVDFLPGEDAFQTEGRWESGGTERAEIYIRALVINTRSRVAKDCQPFVVKLEEVHSSGEITTTFFDSLTLPWPLSKHTVRDIPKGVQQFFDVVAVRKDRPGWRFTWQEQFTNLATLSDHRGTYRFTVLVTGDGVAPDGRKIDVSFDGNPNTIRTFDRGPFPPLRWWHVRRRWQEHRRNR
jgi:hypothetical protein